MWKSIQARYSGICISCKKVINEGEFCEWDMDKSVIKHNSCTINPGKDDKKKEQKETKEITTNKIEKLKDSILKLFIINDINEARKQYHTLSVLEYNQDTSIPPINPEIFNDNKKLKKLNKLLVTSNLDKRVHDLSHKQFMDEFTIMFLNLTRAIYGDKAFKQIKENLDSQGINSIIYEKANKARDEWLQLTDYNISRKTPLKNRQSFSMILSRCTGEFCWEDRYIDKEALLFVLGQIPTKNISSIRVLTSIFSKLIDDELHDTFEQIKEEMKESGLSCHMKVYTNRITHKEEHDRYILGTNIGFAIPSIDQIIKNQKSDLKQKSKENSHHRKKEFLEVWDADNSLDVSKQWEEIKIILDEKNLWRSKTANCSKCKNKTVVETWIIEKGLLPLCRDCRKAGFNEQRDLKKNSVSCDTCGKKTMVYENIIKNQKMPLCSNCLDIRNKNREIANKFSYKRT